MLLLDLLVSNEPSFWVIGLIALILLILIFTRVKQPKGIPDYEGPEMPKNLKRTYEQTPFMEPKSSIPEMKNPPPTPRKKSQKEMRIFYEDRCRTKILEAINEFESLVNYMYSGNDEPYLPFNPQIKPYKVIISSLQMVRDSIPTNNTITYPIRTEQRHYIRSLIIELDTAIKELKNLRNVPNTPPALKIYEDSLILLRDQIINKFPLTTLP